MKKRAMHKCIAAAMAMTMAFTMLTGCGGTPQEDSKEQSDSSVEQTENGTEQQPDEPEEPSESSGAEDSGEWEGEVSKIIMTYPTSGVEPTDMGLVQDAINEITVKEIGVEVEFRPVSIFELPSTCPMWIGGGEQLDLMAVAFTGLQPYILQNMIEPLEQWLDSAPTIQELAKEYPIYDTTSSEHVYGLMTQPAIQGFGGGYLIAVEDLKAAGLSYQDGDMITLDDLDNIFAKIKEAKPDVTPCGVVGSMDRSSMTFQMDTLGATAASGVVIGPDSTEVVNMYASPEYKSYLEHVRSWYEKGYILKDAATTDISLLELSSNGSLSGYFSEGNAGLRVTLEQNTGREYIHLLFNEPYMRAISAAANTYWTVPVTAKEPEAAMRFMDMMYKDGRIINLLVFGIEGKHYVVVDEEAGIISYPEGVTAQTTTYSYGFGLFGMQINNYVMGQSTKEEDLAWNEIALKNKMKSYGFCYDATAMTNQIIAVEAVIAEYTPALTTGSADLETTYAEFLSKLEANGINDIIADKQAQFDAWLEQQ